MDINRNKLTIIEDNNILRMLLKSYLTKAGYVIIDFTTIADAESYISPDNTDILISDISLPDGSGLELIKKYAQIPKMGRIIISVTNNIDSKTVAFNNGVDDYIPKPIDPKELLLRVQALNNRLYELSQVGTDELIDDSNIIMPNFVLNVETRIGSSQYGNVEFGVKEFEGLIYLKQHQGKICLRKHLSNALTLEKKSNKALNMIISRLRKKIAMIVPKKQLIITYPGKGFMLVIS